MKKIEAIIRPAKVGDVCDALEKIGHPGLMITEIEGHGKQMGLEQQFRGETYRTELLPKAKLEIVVKDSDVEKIVKAIVESGRTGEIGDGKIFIYNMEDAVRIRTSERGEGVI